jgi:hypothetical protein
MFKHAEHTMAVSLKTPDFQPLSEFLVATGSVLDLRTTNWPGYAVSQRVHKRVEEIFGWIKTVGNFRRTRYRGIERTSFAAYLVGACGPQKLHDSQAARGSRLYS